jgi:hypothetical protein
MSIEIKYIHFPSWAKVLDGLSKKGVNLDTVDSAKTFLKTSSIDENPFYYYIMFIKESHEVYTHGNFYGPDNIDLSNYNTKDEIIEALSQYVKTQNIASVAMTGSYTDLINKPSIPDAVTSSTVESWGFTKNAGTVTGVKINGSTKSPISGVVDIGTVITSHQDISGKLDSSVAASMYATKTELGNKQNTISDLSTIRSGAALGATALQSIPSEYITESELNAKGYLTSIPSEYVTETELNNKGYATTSSVNSQINTINQTIGVNTTGFTLADRITKLEDGYDAPDERANVLWIGTSIPAGDIQFSNNGTTQSTTTNLGSNNYPKMVADTLGFNLYNNARGASFVCFYPSSDDGTSNWAGKDWTEYQNEVHKGYSLSASMAQVEEKFGPNGLNIPTWLLNNFKSYSYESLIIPYIDGTLASCDTVIIDHGYNDRQQILNETSWHIGDGEQMVIGSGRDWLLKLQDPFEKSLTCESFFQGCWWSNENEVDTKKYYWKAMIFLCKKIWAVNPRIKIIIGNYFATKSNTFGAEFGNDRLGEFICLANSGLANWLRCQCVDVHKYTGLYNRNLAAGNDFQLFCPDNVHPHSDSTGHSNKVIAGVYINALRGTLYK